jgi:tetratricopeptide (TPR) repeat protein
VSSPSPPRALRAARVAATYLVENDFPAARRKYDEALKADPELFEAHYGFAVLEQDAGDARAALASARSALDTAPDDVARSAAGAILTLTRRYTGEGGTPPQKAEESIRR